jgi:hypothetical protein
LADVSEDQKLNSFNKGEQALTTVPFGIFCFSSTLASQRNGVVNMSFLRQLSERLLRVLAQHVYNTISLGTPCFLRGVAVVAAFSGYSFGLLQKSNSPAGRDPQYLRIKRKK